MVDENDDYMPGDLPFAREPFRRDEAWHYTGHCEYRVLIDPAWIELGQPEASFTRLRQLLDYARNVSTPTKIELLFPAYLKPPMARRWEGAFFHGPFVREVKPPRKRSGDYTKAIEKGLAEFKELGARYGADPQATRPEEELDRLIYGGLLFGRPDGLQLLDLVLEHRCDFLLTENPWLLSASQELRPEGIWPAAPEDLLELLQLGLRSAGVFIEVVSPLFDQDWGDLGRTKIGTEGLGFSTFYHLENKTLHSYQRWVNQVAHATQAPGLWNHGRAAFYHRFPFMLYAYDLVRYHASYAQRFAPANRYRGDHRFFVAYHLNAFYVMLAALLDNIAWIWNYALALGFREYDGSRNKCVLSHKEFKKRVRPLRPDFVDLIESADVAKWLETLGLKRHPAVHREPLFLTEIYERETGKLLSDSASVVAEADRLMVFDLLDAADNDLRKLQDFLGRMEKLPIPQPPPTSPARAS